MKNKKSLGQHWLRDRAALTSIVECAIIRDVDSLRDEVVLEIGPGLGTLTSVLLKYFGKVTAVEYDADLAEKLPRQFPGHEKNLTVVNEDFLEYNLGALPKGYFVVANIPYYITGKIVTKLLMAENRPKRVVLLVQKEVAERLAAEAGELSVAAVAAQLYGRVFLGPVVEKELFEPAPKVDSQVVILEPYDFTRVGLVKNEAVMRLVKTGFSSPRKKLAKNLSTGLSLPREGVDELLARAGIDKDVRAEDVAVDDWEKLMVLLREWKT